MIGPSTELTVLGSLRRQPIVDELSQFTPDQIGAWLRQVVPVARQTQEQARQMRCAIGVALWVVRRDLKSDSAFQEFLSTYAEGIGVKRRTLARWRREAEVCYQLPAPTPRSESKREILPPPPPRTRPRPPKPPPKPELPQNAVAFEIRRIVQRTAKTPAEALAISCTAEMLAEARDRLHDAWKMANRAPDRPALPAAQPLARSEVTPVFGSKLKT